MPIEVRAGRKTPST